MVGSRDPKSRRSDTQNPSLAQRNSGSSRSPTMHPGPKPLVLAVRRTAREQPHLPAARFGPTTSKFSGQAPLDEESSTHSTAGGSTVLVELVRSWPL